MNARPPRVQWAVWMVVVLMVAACGGASAPGPQPGNSGGAPAPAASPTRTGSAGPAPSAVPPTAVRPAPTPPDIGMTPLPTSQAGPPQHLAGELRYSENYKSTSAIGNRTSHSVEGWMLLKLKIDPEQSDESKTVWVDDGGVWELKGSGQQSGAPCTNVKDTYSGSGTFQNWNPSVEGTGIMQVTVFNKPANMPPLLTFSVVGHIVSAGTAGEQPGGGCKPFNATNWWPFPTSMAGGMLQGAVDRNRGPLYITFTLMSDPNAPDAFADMAGGYVEGRP